MTLKGNLIQLKYSVSVEFVLLVVLVFWMVHILCCLGFSPHFPLYSVFVLYCFTILCCLDLLYVLKGIWINAVLTNLSLYRHVNRMNTAFLFLYFFFECVIRWIMILVALNLPPPVCLSSWCVQYPQWYYAI